MKLLLVSPVILMVFASFISRNTNLHSIPESPLAEYSTEWNQPRYLQCNTAANTFYMTPEERKTIYILNMIRMNPTLFANTVLTQYPDKGEGFVNRNSSYFKSLMKTLIELKPVNLLYPDSLCFVSAKCHALTTGEAGTVTHNRTTEECRRKEKFNGECCHYGEKTALDILVSLLIDEGVPSLGHRAICLGNYKKLGVSIQPHIVYRNTAVLDFEY